MIVCLYASIRNSRRFKFAQHASEKMMHGQAGASSSSTPHAHAERLERKVPRLALVPRDQPRDAAARSPTKASKQQQKKKRIAVKELHRHDEIGAAANAGHENKEPTDLHENEYEAELDGGLSEQTRQEHQLRLGERFLRMMSMMARLSRMQLDAGGGDEQQQQQIIPKHQQLVAVPSSPPTALEKIIQKRELQAHDQSDSPHKAPPPGSTSPAKGAAAPVIVPVNPASEPLRPHLTFEISMLLPAPMDTRQSSLQSPIRRNQLRPRRRKRRRQRRAREKRTWQTSHATWVPRASADYIHERARQGTMASSSSKLMEKFAQLKRAAESPLAKSSSMSALSDRKYLYAFPNLNTSCSQAARNDQEDESDGTDEDDCEGESGESSDASDDEANGHECHESTDQQRMLVPENNEPPFSSLPATEATSHTHPNEVPPIHSITLEIEESQLNNKHGNHHSSAASSTTEPHAMSRSPTRKRPLYHQPAWISPELKTWLINSGMFQTKPRHALR